MAESSPADVPRKAPLAADPSGPFLALIEVQVTDGLTAPPAEALNRLGGDVNSHRWSSDGLPMIRFSAEADDLVEAMNRGIRLVCEVAEGSGLPWHLLKAQAEIAWTVSEASIG